MATGSGSASGASGYATTSIHTRGEMKRDIATIMRETWDTEQHGEPFGLDAVCGIAVENICREVNCYWVSESADLTGTSSVYQEYVLAPTMQYIRSARIALDGSTEFVLYSFEDSFRTVPWMDSYYPNWKEDPPGGTPQYLIISRPYIYFYPQPDWAEVGGIVFYGWGRPTSWDGDDSTFPLSDSAYWACVYEACYLRCIQYPTKENIARLPFLDRERVRHRGNLDMEVETERDRSRSNTVIY